MDYKQILTKYGKSKEQFLQLLLSSTYHQYQHEPEMLAAIETMADTLLLDDTGMPLDVDTEHYHYIPKQMTTKDTDVETQYIKNHTL